MLTRRTATDGYEVWMQVNKKLLRRAMECSRTRTDGGPDCSSIPKLALAAQVSNASVGFLVTEKKSGRESCSVEMANKIAAALGWDVDELFTEGRLPTRRVLTRAERLALLDGVA